MCSTTATKHRRMNLTGERSAKEHMLTRDLKRLIGRLRRVAIWIVRAISVGVVILICIGAYFWFSTTLPAPDRLRARAALGNTRILDRNGKLLYQVLDPLSGQQQPVALRDMPLALRQATVALEDSSFYTNSGIDLRGIVRAGWINLRSGGFVAGGSTITQQLARGFLLDPDVAQQRSLVRKIREIVLALKLNAAYSKDEILELYLNQTYYGGLSYGVEAAARHYFNKPVRDLDLAECALLAGLPQAPSRYDPLRGGAFRAAALTRQGEALDAMVRAGYVRATAAATARVESLQFASGLIHLRAPHFIQYVLSQLEAQLGAETVARGGLTVTTTLDIDLNDAAQSSLSRQISALATPLAGAPDHHVRNGAVVVLNPTDGAILAMVGSPDFDNAAIQGQVNATVALRQPGSAIKPLTYAAAMEHGWTPATTILDIPSTFTTREGQPYIPENYDRTYHGPLSLREALATSSNVSAVRTLDAIGIKALLEIARRLGITTLDADEQRYGLALTLGGGEVTLLELTGAYAVFANGGYRVTPYAITEIQGPKSEAKPQFTTFRPPSRDSQPILSPQIAYLITDILSDRHARMREFGEVSPLDIDRPAAAKTGTTTDWHDNWTIGYTPDRTVGVWVGNADGEPMESITGITGAGPVWNEVMRIAHRGLPSRPFIRPAEIVELSICAEGGLLPGPACPGTRLERFIEGTQPQQVDNTHILLNVDPVMDCRAPADYPVQRTVQHLFRILPPEAEAWAVAHDLPQVPSRECPSVVGLDGGKQESSPAGSTSAIDSRATEPALLLPAPYAVFAISPGIPRSRQRIELKARSGPNAVRLIIYVDGQAVATFHGPPYDTFWTLATGHHRVVVEVQDSHARISRSEPVEFSVQ